ncbi:MAG: hypothetical protein K0R38_3113 [Polyangiaceae bacterium]|jgi:prepilin-type N-terminal cleavage/methylation domain-containing protein|nr:hypothetical protein [Polyangiaceae bacterium]
MTVRLPFGKRQRGFTLVELMVAMSGGLFLSIAVFALSRDATRFYQSEGRIANATLAAVSGFERLSSDVARAGHLSTANIQADPLVCNRPDASFPAELRALRALVVGTSTVTGTEVASAGIAPHSLVVTGALNTPEVFTTMAVAEGAGGSWRVDLDLGTPTADRLGLSLAPTAVAANQALLNGIFTIGTNQRGKIVRLRRNGLDQYAVVSSVTAVVGGAFLTLANSPALLRLVKGGPQCGIDDTGKGMSLTVIDVVRYDIRKMIGDAAYASLFTASGASVGGGPSTVAYETGRAELVRVEVDASGAEEASTREIIGEYAVDLQVSGWRADSGVNPTLVPVAAETITQSYAFTQLLRGVRVRVGVRSREADREANIAGTGGGANGLYRIGLGASGTAPFARVRTLQSDIPLRNLEGNRW